MQEFADWFHQSSWYLPMMVFGYFCNLWCLAMYESKKWKFFWAFCATCSVLTIYGAGLQQGRKPVPPPVVVDLRLDVSDKSVWDKTITTDVGEVLHHHKQIKRWYCVENGKWAILLTLTDSAGKKHYAAMWELDKPDAPDLPPFDNSV